LRRDGRIGILRAVRHIVLGLVLPLLVGACAYGEIRQVLRAEFANELDCPEVQIQKKGFSYLEENPDAERYLLKGCGVMRTYTCPPDQGMVPYEESGCTWTEGDADREKYASEEPGEETAGGEDDAAESDDGPDDDADDDDGDAFDESDE